MRGTIEAFVRAAVMLSLLCVAASASVPVAAQQAKKDEAPPAPLPAQLLAAKKVFIANAPGENLPKALGAPVRTYNEFYAAMRKMGSYELVPAPADADLIFEISFASSLAEVSGSSTTGCSSSTDYSVKLVILDAQTRVPLWWFTQSVALQGGFSHRKDTLDSVYVQAIASLVEDVKNLAAAK
jgi:hypothetical protein